MSIVSGTPEGSKIQLKFHHKSDCVLFTSLCPWNREIIGKKFYEVTLTILKFCRNSIPVYYYKYAFSGSGEIWCCWLPVMAGGICHTCSSEMLQETSLFWLHVLISVLLLFRTIATRFDHRTYQAPLLEHQEGSRASFCMYCLDIVLTLCWSRDWASMNMLHEVNLHSLNPFKGTCCLFYGGLSLSSACSFLGFYCGFLFWFFLYDFWIVSSYISCLTCYMYANKHVHIFPGGLVESHTHCSRCGM